MVRLSRYAHVYDLGDDVALYHSLRMKPVYLNKRLTRTCRHGLQVLFAMIMKMHRRYQK